eukprot:PhF_6_TR37591/c0_g1_i3/m.55792
MSFVLLICITLTYCISAVFSACATPSYDLSLTLKTNSLNTNTNCSLSVLADLSARDSMVETMSCTTTSTWGPTPILYPTADIPTACQPIPWAYDRILQVAKLTVEKKYNYCHHHAATWLPPTDASFRTTSDPCGSELPITAICSSLGSTLPQPFNGVDCSSYTSRLYNFGFGIRLVTAIDDQACGPNAPGVLLPYTINDILNSYAPPLLPGDLLYIASSGTPVNISISHVIMWTGIQMSTTDPSSPYYKDTLLSNMPSCQQGAQLTFINNRIAAGLPVWVTTDSHGYGPRFRAFSGWYVSAFSHVRRLIDTTPVTGAVPKLSYSTTNGCMNVNAVKYVAAPVTAPTTTSTTTAPNAPATPTTTPTTATPGSVPAPPTASVTTSPPPTAQSTSTPTTNVTLNYNQGFPIFKLSVFGVLILLLTFF